MTGSNFLATEALRRGEFYGTFDNSLFEVHFLKQVGINPHLKKNISWSSLIDIFLRTLSLMPVPRNANKLSVSVSQWNSRCFTKEKF
jgi:hypothetical protein